jgi:hypothetical protein
MVAAVCALLVILGVLASLWKGNSAVSFAMFQTNYVPRIVLRNYPPMDLETNDLIQIRAYLATHQGHGNYNLPAALASAHGTGCAILQWHGKRISMVCFNSGKTNPATTPDLFLFVLDKDALSHTPTGASPQFARVRKLATATWTNGSETYLLAGLQDENSLRKYFEN